jgi:hypothetical protein
MIIATQSVIVYCKVNTNKQSSYKKLINIKFNKTIKTIHYILRIQSTMDNDANSCACE